MNRITRKNFLKMTTFGAMSIPPLTSFNRTDTKDSMLLENENEKPIFKFVQANDLHIQADLTRYLDGTGGNNHFPTYEDANVRAFWLLEALKNGPFFKDVDFVLGVGDLIHGESLEGIKYDLDYFNTYFYKNFPVPLYPAIGNHEVRQQEGDPVWEAPYKELFGKDRVNYSFLHKGFHFIIINNAGSHMVKDEVILKNRAAVLESMLKEHSGMPKIVCCHIPLVYVREQEVLAKSFGFSSYYTKERELLELVEKYKVLAVLTGHLHISGTVVKNSVYHIDISGTASYPHDSAMYTVYKDRIDVELFRVPSDILVPNTNIHGAKRFGIDFTDNLHRDYTTYIMGNANERFFSIQLK